MKNSILVLILMFLLSGCWTTAERCTLCEDVCEQYGGLDSIDLDGTCWCGDHTQIDKNIGDTK